MTDEVRDWFDALGEGEWNRFDQAPYTRASLEMHRRFLRRHVPEGSNVLEIGAGPGRFTIELARRGCQVTVTDLSPVQLDLSRRYIAEAGCEDAVVERRVLDLRDLSSIGDDAYDAVVAYGGPLSYVFDDAERCLAEMLRVVRPGGVVINSVMSLIGTLRQFLVVVPSYAAKDRLGMLKDVMATGDNRLDLGAHPCRMYRWSEVAAMVERLPLPCDVVGASASNFLASGDPRAVAAIEEQPELWQLLLDWDEQYAAEPGALDSGTHLLFAVRKRAPASG